MKGFIAGAIVYLAIGFAIIGVLLMQALGWAIPVVSLINVVWLFSKGEILVPWAYIIYMSIAFVIIVATYLFVVVKNTK